MFKVLIVDDHAGVRQGVRQVLDEHLEAAQPGEAESADEAIEMVRRDAWDVVILDVNMPGKSGMYALRALKKAHPALPVLMFSVTPPDQVAQRFIAAGAAGYVSKAGPADELVAAVRRAVGQKPDGSSVLQSGALAPDDSLTAWHL